MAFFDDLGKKVSQGTRNLADTTRLNGVISDSKKKIDRLYAQLGQAIYEAHKDDEAPEQPELIGELNALFAGITQAENELLQLRSMVRCPNCGAEIPKNAQFCPKCGTKQPLPPQPPQPAQRFCPGCGAPAAPGNRFCNLCGTPLETAAPVQPTYPQAAPQGYAFPQEQQGFAAPQPVAAPAEPQFYAPPVEAQPFVPAEPQPDPAPAELSVEPRDQSEE